MNTQRTQFALGFVLSVALALTLSAPVAAQNAVVRITGFDATQFPTVRAFVSVTDANGRALQALPRDAFQLTEDGRTATVLAINASQDPIHVGLVLDHSGSMDAQAKLNDAQIAASAFADEMRPQDEAFVTMFDDRTDHLQDFTSDQAALKNAIRRIAVRGGTAFYDAVYDAAQKFENRKEQRKNALIVLTDGRDNREEGGGFFGLFTGAGSKRTLDQAIAKAKELKVAVYTVGLGNDVDQPRLQKIATETGGKFYYAPRGEQLKELYRLIAEQLQKEYALDFTSPRALADGTQRQVTLTVALPNGAKQTADGLYVAGYLFNRIRANWVIGALLALVLLMLGILPTLGRAVAHALTPRPTPVLPSQLHATPATPAAAPRCPHCDQPVRVNAKFCGACGKALAAVSASVCPQCGAAVRQGAKFCGACRYALR